MNLYLDVETVPSMQPLAKLELRGSIKPPATLKKPESIDAWWENESEQALDDAWRKQALDGGTLGEIVSIAICDDFDRSWVRCRRAGESEADLLRQSFAVVEEWTADDAKNLVPGISDPFPIDDHHPVAHNAAFDLGFLWRRSVVHGIQRPRWLPGPMARAGKDYACTMQAWVGFGQRISLDNLCRALGLPSPKDSGLDGSKILDVWLAGEWERIERYNADDAWAVREIWHRLHGLPRAA
jgi:3'-5' exonuclease